MLPLNKNSFLHAQTTINPRIINRCVDKALDNPTRQSFKAQPSFQRVTSQQPCTPICAITRTPLPFGRYAIPKLKVNLRSKDYCILKQTLETICDMLHDSELCFELINKRLPARLAHLIHHEETYIRTLALEALSTLANHLDGKMAIAKNDGLLKILIGSLSDENRNVRILTITLLKSLSSSWMLCDSDLIEILTEFLDKNRQDNDDTYIVLILETLYNLIFGNGGKAMALEDTLFSICVDLLKTTTKSNIICAALKLLSLLMQTESGRELAYQNKIVKRILFKHIFAKEGDVVESTLHALLFATIKIEALAKVHKLCGLIDRLIELAKGYLEATTQKLAFQVLVNLTHDGIMKKCLLLEKLKELNAIHVENYEACKAKRSLMCELIMQ